MTPDKALDALVEQAQQLNMGYNMTIEWKKYPDEKPQDGSICYIYNDKARGSGYLAQYALAGGYFKQYDPIQYKLAALEVTHFVELPWPPKATS